jgi:precorrin isomerase
VLEQARASRTIRASEDFTYGQWLQYEHDDGAAVTAALIARIFLAVDAGSVKSEPAIQLGLRRLGRHARVLSICPDSGLAKDSGVTTAPEAARSRLHSVKSRVVGARGRFRRGDHDGAP